MAASGHAGAMTARAGRRSGVRASDKPSDVAGAAMAMDLYALENNQDVRVPDGFDIGPDAIHADVDGQK